MAVRLRPAVAADVQTLAALQSASFEDLWSPGAMEDLLAMPGAFALIAEQDGTPRGFVLARAAAGEAEILSIAVHGSARRRGLGRALLAAALDAATARRARTIFLEVAVDNAAALGLYTALGFSEAGRRRAYYPREGRPATDALILKADLPRPS